MFNPLFGRDTLSLEEVEALPEFRKLNSQRQNFIRHWIAGAGDQFFAFNQSYSAPDSETARKGSYAIARSKSVKDVLDLFLKKTKKETFLEEKKRFIKEIDRVIRTQNPKPSQLRALELKASMLFGVDVKSLRKEQ